MSVACIAVMVLTWVAVGNTLSYYFDNEVSQANSFTAGTWDTPQNQPAAVDAPLVLSLSAPQDTGTGDPPADPPVSDIQISDAVTVIDGGTPPQDPPVIVQDIQISDPLTVVTDAPADTTTPAPLQ